MKALSRTLFAAYIFILLWLLLFKFSYDPVAVIRDYQTQGFNLVPFTRAQKSEMIWNFVAFIPFGVMLGVGFKHVGFRSKIAVIFAFSLAVEIVQFAVAIGITDITDIITNTLGGFTGLAVYAAVEKHANGRYLDRGILVLGTLSLLTILYLRIFVFIVKY